MMFSVWCFLRVPSSSSPGKAEIYLWFHPPHTPSVPRDIRSSPCSQCIASLLNPLFSEHGIINSTGFLLPIAVDLRLSIWGRTGVGNSPLLQNTFRLVRGVWSVSANVIFYHRLCCVCRCCGSGLHCCCWHLHGFHCLGFCHDQLSPFICASQQHIFHLLVRGE